MNSLTLKQFADGINKHLADNPEHADLPVITARDDEGNGYNLVYYSPTYGHEWEVNADPVEGVCVS